MKEQQYEIVDAKGAQDLLAGDCLIVEHVTGPVEITSQFTGASDNRTWSESELHAAILAGACVQRPVASPQEEVQSQELPWRPMKEGELLQEGDQWKVGGRWEPTDSAGNLVGNAHPHRTRRPVQSPVEEGPGEGYRWVADGEVYEVGDEWVFPDETIPVHEKQMGEKKHAVQAKTRRPITLKKSDKESWAEKHAKELEVGKWFKLPGIGGDWQYTGRCIPGSLGLDLKAWFVHGNGNEDAWWADARTPFVLCDPQPEAPQQLLEESEFETLIGLKPEDLREGDQIGPFIVTELMGADWEISIEGNESYWSEIEVVGLLSMAPVLRKKVRGTTEPIEFEAELYSTHFGIPTLHSKKIPTDLIGKLVKVTVETISKGEC